MNNITTIIKGNPSFSKKKEANQHYLNIAEFFCDTIQGEGIHVGHPATFLRMQYCSQSCVWCDTKEVWRYGNPYTFEELFELMEKFEVIEKLKQGQHLVFTGGSPVLQQDKLILFIYNFIKKYKFKPFIEIENECAIMPSNALMMYIDCWNNSPKLSSSGNPTEKRYNPEILSILSKLENSWFKFVVSCEEDWEEIEHDFLIPNLIKKNQIILMPLGATREELEKNRENVVELAVVENVRYCTREHIVLWDKKTGV